MVFSVTSPGRFLWRYPKTLRQVYILRSDPEGPLHRMAGPWFRLLASPKTRFLGVSEATTRKLASSWGFRRSDERLEYLRNPGAVEGEPLPTFSGTTKQILMVGRVHESKNPFFWLDVAKGVISEASERLRFVWLGDGALRAKAIAYAEKIGIGHLVSFPGFTRDPYPVYRESFLYLHLARTEPLGNAVVDAQAFGIPSVVSAIGGLPEIVVDGLNGRTVEIESITPAVDAVIEIIENRQTHLRMSLAARKLFEERFSGGVWEEQFLDKIGHGSIP